MFCVVFKRTSVRLSKREKIYHRLARVSTDLVPLIIYQITTIIITIILYKITNITCILCKITNITCSRDPSRKGCFVARGSASVCPSGCCD